MDHKKAEELLKKYLAGECTPEERAIVESAYNKLSAAEPAYYDEAFLREASQASWKSIHAKNHLKSGLLKKRLFTYASAAAVLLMVAAGFYFREYSKAPPVPLARAIKDVMPGGNKATLTLGNGNTIILDQAATGKIATHITKVNNGAIAYAPSSAATGFNTIATPKGGQYQVTLPDGSKVWLNAASTLRFPAAFTGQANRLVTLTGEAYFEIARNEKQPFIVKTANQQVEVLGTHFNVNSYPDEDAVKTTLLEGAVRIFSTQLNVSKTLQPGQTALHQNNRILIQPADDNAIAWKNGMIKFYQADLQSIMKQVSRWYNLDVKYEGPVSTKRFTGGISRDSNLSELLQILEGVGIHFSLEQQQNGNVLIVKN